MVLPMIFFCVISVRKEEVPGFFAAAGEIKEAGEPSPCFPWKFPVYGSERERV
jgi:hypothetical protein